MQYKGARKALSTDLLPRLTPVARSTPCNCRQDGILVIVSIQRRPGIYKFAWCWHDVER